MIHRALEWRCVVCGATREITETAPWRCPNTTAEDRHHVLHLVNAAYPLTTAGLHPFADHDADFAWSAYAAAHGMNASARASLVYELDDAVAAVAGTGFEVTPCLRSGALSDALGFDHAGGVWVKDETGGVAGSHKARHLFTILLHLRAAELLGELDPAARQPLAIASCGNAALAAATLAKAAEWPINVYVPTWMDDAFGTALVDLGARVHRCPRAFGDPPGDPAMLRFREAVAAGAIPFTVQGPENALCLDGGRTIGWEIGRALRGEDTPPDAVFVQVGGGALAGCLGQGLADECGSVALYAVQAEGCAPLHEAWRRAGRGRPPAASTVASQWDELMTPWDNPESEADGILDDETYDWLAVFDAMRLGNGLPVVAPETTINDAHRLAREAGFDVSATGSAGLAGLMEARQELADDARVVVAMTGVSRDFT